MERKQVCSTTHLFHYLINPNMDDLKSFLDTGIRPLSDFPESDRWRQLEEQMPGFYENLFNMIAQPLILRSYPNSGIFITPIDFRKLPGSYLYQKPRFVIPIDRLDPDWIVITHVLKDQRASLPFDQVGLEYIASIWDEDMVRQWFGLDKTKMFFYVPQAACYQGKISVFPDDYQEN